LITNCIFFFIANDIAMLKRKSTGKLFLVINISMNNKKIVYHELIICIMHAIPIKASLACDNVEKRYHK